MTFKRFRADNCERGNRKLRKSSLCTYIYIKNTYIIHKQKRTDSLHFENGYSLKIIQNVRSFNRLSIVTKFKINFYNNH